MRLAWLVRRASLQQDADGSLIHHRQMKRYAAIAAVVFAITFSIASVDWLMSLDARWVSTLFAVYLFGGLLVHGVAAVTLVAALLRARPRAVHHGGPSPRSRPPAVRLQHVLGISVGQSAPADLAREHP